MQKRLSRFSRRSIVVAIVGVAFAAAAGVGLAQITARPSPTVAAASTATTQSTTDPTTSSVSGDENDFAKEDDDDADDDELEFEKSHEQTTSSTTQATTSTSQQTTTTGDEGNGQQKVAVCHMTGSGKSHTINIAEPAVAAHTAHGDTEGECAETTTTSATTSTTAAIEPQSSTRTHAKKTKPAHVTTHVSRAKPMHVSHAKPARKPHGNSAHQSHGNSAGGNGNGHGKK